MTQETQHIIRHSSKAVAKYSKTLLTSYNFHQSNIHEELNTYFKRKVVVLKIMILDYKYLFTWYVSL